MYNKGNDSLNFSAAWSFKNVFVQFFFSTCIHLPFVNLRKKNNNNKNQHLCLIRKLQAESVCFLFYLPVRRFAFALWLNYYLEIGISQRWIFEIVWTENSLELRCSKTALSG